ncbi:hypothetical protein KVR01_011249 [Diaporthe batatas]|uniref:uncharacterized protein n=1 Tax=Diaporthe batatas TaxID=748121 RepID=UPI001D04842F|nr:uncharacterized protein KVR01_011249 [Diaporthe batatas]KAG8158806.1 hypothetical protein KVR01_011249 [Diaporthe batatas]
MTNQTAWADAASTVTYNVHLGTWINWSRGRLMGATLTLNRVDGSLLISFTAVFVGIVAGRFWRIACILFYRCYSSPDPRDALYHQQQAILRNSNSAVSAIWTFSQLLWAWQNIAKRCFVRLLPTILTATLCLCAFTVAGGFSSSISSGISDEVLVNGTNCASIVTTSADPKSRHFLAPYDSQLTHAAATYARQCYSSAPGNFDCTSFVRSQLASTVDNQAACPFRNASICRSNTSNTLLDTGYIDLNKDLGVNAPPDQNFQFRAVLHCAPLETQGYTESIRGAYTNFTTYNYGPRFSGVANYTHMVETLRAQYTRQPENILRGEGRKFILSVTRNTVFQHQDQMENATFVPIPALFRPDGDTALIFLSGNGIQFFEKSNDPWYRGTLPGDRAVSPGADGENSLYIPEEAASPMGCVQQFQFCNPSLSSNSCSPLGSWTDAQLEAAHLFGISISGDDERDSFENNAIGSRYQWLLTILASVDIISAVINSLGPDALTSMDSLSNGLMGPLPDDQWQQDVSFWWATYLAGIQAAVVEVAHGPANPAMDPYKRLPFNSYVQDMCNNQKVRSTTYISFSLFGLYFTFITGVLFITTSYTLEPIFQCLYRRRKYKEYTYLEWAASETLQLQRIGFQGAGLGIWSGYTNNVPKTEPGEILEGLALKYPAGTNSTDGDFKTPEKTSSNANSVVHAASSDQEAEEASLDELLGTSGSQADEDQSPPIHPTTSRVILESRETSSTSMANSRTGT